MKRICVATNNPGKKKEYEEILGPLGYEVVTAKDLGLVSDPQETGTNYQENSYIKALSLCKLAHLPVVADDSGLEVNALDKFPGLHSSRFAKQFSSYPEAWAALEKMLEGKEDRSAQFVCCICYLEKEDARPIYFEGVCPGYILPEPKGNHGFGYDPIFHSNEANANFGELTDEEKNQYSHRGKAAAKLLAYLSK